MNIQTIYEATNDFTPFSLPFIIICLVFILAIVYAIKVWKKSNVGVKIGLILVPVLMSIVIISQFSNFFRTEKVFSDFQKGNCKIAEGEIENYEQYYEVGTMAKEDYPDRFFVDGTEFIVYGYSTYGIEYFWRQDDGSPLQEGQYVRITYENCFYQNLILKVELIEKDNTE
ncbi:MAG: hypothetical protein J1F23_06085 [Oscillospiraceae bacterium]|nr:hypothetical protein [Oscillospiraceae bacterium]